MPRKLTCFITLFCAAFLICLLLSPTALAAGSNSGCNSNNSVYFQGVKQIFGQNVVSCPKNINQISVLGNQAREYKITEACPQPVATSCKQTSINSSNCNSGKASANRVICNNSTVNSSCVAAKTTQTAKPAQSAATGQGSANTVAISNYAQEVVRLVNVERANNNLSPLALDKQLTAAALVRAEEATVKFSHTRPNGSSCFSVLSSMGISYRRAGENIAIGQSSPSQVVKAWMDSPGHRANILGDYTKIGVGVQQAGSNFSGYAWAQFFTK